MTIHPEIIRFATTHPILTTILGLGAMACTALVVKETVPAVIHIADRVIDQGYGVEFENDKVKSITKAQPLPVRETLAQIDQA